MFGKRYGLGAIPDPVDERDFPISAILIEEILPENFVIPAFRHWFTEDYEPIREIIEAEGKNQGQLPTCVSQACSFQKGAQEGKELSARFHHTYCKALDGYSGQGTYIRGGQKILVDYGDCEEKIYPERNDISYSNYIDINLLSAQMKENANKYRSKSYFNVRPEEMVQTLYQTKSVIVTGSDWYEGDNKCRGVWEEAEGRKVGGHAFSLIGYKTFDGVKALIAVNSWGTNWGDNGIFYIFPPLFSRLYLGWVTVDITRTLAEVLIKYSNRVVKAEKKADVYLIQGGYKRVFLDEFSLWSNGYKFAGDITLIDPDDLLLIPESVDMPFNYDYNWGKEQIKELVRFCVANQGEALKQFETYFKS